METQLESTQSKESFIPTMQLSNLSSQVSDLREKLPDISVAHVLGVTSVLVGVAKVVLSKDLAKKSGLAPKYVPVVRAFGVREIATGVALLASENKKTWKWMRVLGDVMDSALFGYAYYNERQPDRRKKMKKASAVMAPIAAADVLAALKSQNA